MYLELNKLNSFKINFTREHTLVFLLVFLFIMLQGVQGPIEASKTCLSVWHAKPSSARSLALESKHWSWMIPFFSYIYTHDPNPLTRTAIGILTTCWPSVHVKLPNLYSPGIFWSVEKATLKERTWILELKLRTRGSTSIFTPLGACTTALYVDIPGPTFVTVLMTVIVLLRVGIVMEGRLRFNPRRLSLLHLILFVLKFDIALPL